MRKFNVINHCKSIQSEIELTKVKESYIDGTAYIVNSWTTDDNGNEIVYERNFFANFSIKFDGCSHFYFTGEEGGDDTSSYYHICGKSSYMNHLTTMVAIHKIAADLFGESFCDDKLDPRFLEGYSIEEVNNK